MGIPAKRVVVVFLTLSAWISSTVYADDACMAEATLREATGEAIQRFIADRQVDVLTFEGYSGSEYEDPAAMLGHALRTLDAHDPATILVNIGATEVGIGAVYEVAKQKGFTTMGIVSTLARHQDANLSPCVDYVFFVPDSTWGGQLSATNELSPTSRAIVEASTSFVAIGGGDVAKDELLAARAAGKSVTFIPADMNHAKTRAKARKKGLPDPTDFRGSAHRALFDGG